MKATCGILGWRCFNVFSVFIFVFGAKAFAQTTDPNSLVPTVTIQATDPIAITYQPGNSVPPPWEPLGKLGVFTVFRQGNTNLTLNVYYQIGGTASNGVDYAQISNWVTIPAGATSNSILILPLANRPSPSVIKSVVLQLAPPLTLNPVNYEIGVPSNAVVYIETTNPPPVTPVSIGSPTKGTLFYLPTNIEIVAEVSGWGGFPGFATNVEFFAGTNNLGGGIPGPSAGLIGTSYSLIWTNPPPGNYALTAVATSYNGTSITSAPVNIIVEAVPPPADLPPVVGIIAPTNGTVFPGPTNMVLFAQASDPDGAVSNVEFFAGTNDLGEGYGGILDPLGIGGVVGPVYLFNWPAAPPGNYPLTAVATDNKGMSTTSAPVNITVLQGPAATHGYITAVLRSGCTSAPTPPPPVGGTRVGSDYVIMTVADADPTDWANAQRLVTDAIFESLMPQYCALPKTGCVTDSVQWNIITYGANGNPMTSGCAASGCQLHSCEAVPPPTNLPPLVSIFVPTNGAVFFVSTNVGASITNVTYIELLAKAIDPNGTVTNVEFFAGTNDLGACTPVVLDPPGVNGVTGFVYSIYWRNPFLGNYVLTAVATDDGGVSATSAAVNVTIQPIPPPPTNPPPVVRIISPANGAVFFAPITIPIYATVPSGFHADVQFFAGTNSLDLDPEPVPPFSSTTVYSLTWSNAPTGAYALTARAGLVGINNSIALMVTSPPVNIMILPSPQPPTNRPSIVSIVATDPVAIEGTNRWAWPGETNSPPTWAAWPTAIHRNFTNYGPKTATFTVRRLGSISNDLTVPYAIGGTASNGVDYVALPGSVTISAGQRRALITIVPNDDGPPDVNKTVVLALTPSTNTPPDYLLGFPRRAAAIIIDSNGPRPVTGLLPGGSFHLVTPGPDAAWFCIEYSTNLNDWTPVCTNQVINGSIDFVDPDVQSNPSRFYRAVPLTNPPSE